MIQVSFVSGHALLSRLMSGNTWVTSPSADSRRMQMLAGRFLVGIVPLIYLEIHVYSLVQTIHETRILSYSSGLNSRPT